MKQYVAGWDGGGTKTAIQIRDLQGNIIHNGLAGPLNYNSQKKEDIRNTVQTLIHDMERIAGSLDSFRSLCISTAGVSNKEAISVIENEVRNTGFKSKLLIVGDQEAALYGAMGRPEGMVLISGTGSICFGKNHKGKTFRSGGWGHLIDDEGSGYAIGRDILTAAVRSYDKRSQESILLNAVLHAIHGETIEDIIHFTYKEAKSKKDIAGLAPLLIPAIEMNDPQAVAICNKAARELTKLVVTVARELQMETGELAFLGGILKHYHCIQEQLKENLRIKMPHMKLKEAEHDSVAGAALMAIENLEIE
ncbi:N-acetylglucosamine kinase [Vallitalea okinawensis]|uniref:N-acetylglucosamine kinase n=1 Tax=Vallitalea okinawensis TaxID=2078660 RepID=UPI000CFCADD9|nr:BadF/BadG/BcrA/BcrD ATPase family protein [Vallitalea okinawensis]